MLHVILFQPDIPQNTGNIGRMCAFAGARLHLIYPMGFTITDRHLRRSGMDYWRSLDVHHYENWQAFIQNPERPQRIWLFTTKAERSYWEASYADGDGLLFGRETAGVPDWLHQWAGEYRVKVPQLTPDLRSLNLSTCAGIGVYEALRQLHVKATL